MTIDGSKECLKDEGYCIRLYAVIVNLHGSACRSITNLLDMNLQTATSVICEPPPGASQPVKLTSRLL
ncbi:hypothetical protein L2E82_16974 [Cichorium intybus]|uniref:Uncharacterized protein n=1 Tax=Cichorium intybus TaxID=13427 RepID=A0ACB9F7N3_CICIN|nr:hypothetical protein L2E82_16974 [Cichorium intybus]